jgi:hypothetical protein
VSLIANELNATFERNATSGTQRSNSTVFASRALIALTSPVYAFPSNVLAAQSTLPVAG